MDNLFFVNFKNYPQAFEGFPKIYQELEDVARKYPEISTIFAPPPLLFIKVAEIVKVPLWAQHLDPYPLGKFTGFLPTEALVKVGAVGAFLNHSEHPLDDEMLEKTVKVAKEAGLSVLTFAATPEVARNAKELTPDFIAYEPLELIGAGVREGISVATAKPDIISQAVEAARPIPLIIGAGVFQREDIRVGLELGAVGAVASSAIVTAPEPAKVLNELLSAF